MLWLKISGRIVNAVSISHRVRLYLSTGGIMRLMTGGEYFQDRKGIEVNMIGKSFQCFISFGGKKRSNMLGI